VEIFTAAWPGPTSVVAGKRLRLVDSSRFRVVYTLDNWKTTLTKESRPVGYAVFVADVETPAGQDGKVIFTLYWMGEDKWLGRNVEVETVGA
jgi:glucoamylase